MTFCLTCELTNGQPHMSWGFLQTFRKWFPSRANIYLRWTRSWDSRSRLLRCSPAGFDVGSDRGQRDGWCNSSTLHLINTKSFLGCGAVGMWAKASISHFSSWLAKRGKRRKRDRSARSIAPDRHQRHRRHLRLKRRIVLLVCPLHVVLPHHRRFLGAGLRLSYS
jgi:hypothetical protein